MNKIFYRMVAVIGVTLALAFGVLMLPALAAAPPAKPAAPTSTEVGGLITTNTTWGLSGSPYILTQPVTVAAWITLTIEPGVIVKGRDGTGLFIKGELDAIGTESQPITFTSDTDTDPGQWAGLRFYGGDAGDRGYGTLDHVIIRYGGQELDTIKANLSVRWGQATVTVRNSEIYSVATDANGIYAYPRQLIISNTVISGGGLYGLYAPQGSTEGITLTHSTVQGFTQGGVFGTGGTFGLEYTNIYSNGGYAFSTQDRLLHGLGVGNAFVGNEFNRILIEGTTSYLENDATLYDYDGLDGYELKAGGGVQHPPVTVGDGATLTIEPGVTVMGREGTGMWVKGALSAIGISTKPITFTAVTNTVPGGWVGLRFYGGEGALEYASVWYGGDWLDSVSANIGARGNSRVTISNTQVYSASGQGVYATGSVLTFTQATIAYNTVRGVDANTGSTVMAQQSDFAHNGDAGVAVDVNSYLTVRECNFDDNGYYPLMAPANSIHNLSDNVLSGNTPDRIAVWESSLGVNSRWNATNQPSSYELLGDLTVNGGVTLTLEPDVTLMGRDGKGLLVNGRLNAVGAVTQPITFTAVNAGAGNWAGLRFNGGAGTLEYVTVRYGGDPLDGVMANIGVKNNSNVTLRYSHILASSEYGLYAEPTVIVQDNDFANNVYYPIGIAASQVPNLRNNTFSGNNANRILIIGTAVNTSATWPGAAQPVYELADNLTVNNGVTLTVEPGATVIGRDGKGLLVNGTLNAIGTVTQPITFTAVTAGAGNWAGLRFNGASGNAGRGTLEYVNLFYGGDALDSVNANLAVKGANASVAIRHSAIYSETATGTDYGIYLADGTLVISDTLIRGGGDYGVYVAGSSLTLADSRIEKFSGYAARLTLGVLPGLGAGNAFSGNSVNRIQLQSGSLAANATLRYGAGLEGYELEDGVLTINAGVTLGVEGGAQVFVRTNRYLNVNGVLNAIGTPTRPITFTSFANSGPGQWGGIIVQSGAAADLRYTTIRYAGQYNTWGYASINVAYGTLRLENSQVRDSRNAGNADFGVHLCCSGLGASATISNTLFANIGDDDSALDYAISSASDPITVANSTFQNVIGYPIHARGNDLHRISGNTFISNTFNRILLQQSNVADRTHLTAQSGLEGYEFAAELQVPAGCTLFIDPGVAVMARSGVPVHVLGHLEAIGTPTQPITFTSAANSGPGQWSGIYIQNGSGNFAYVTLRYAGQANTYGVAIGALLLQSTDAGPRDRVTLDHVTLRDNANANAEYGININGSYVTLKDSLITANGNATNDYAINLGAGILTVTHSLIHGNAGWGLYVGQATLVMSGTTISNSGNYGLDIRDFSSLATLTDSTISDTARQNAGTLNLDGAVTFADLALNGGTFNGGSAQINLTRHFTRTGGTFNAGSGSVAFTGATTQNLTLNTPTTFNNLSVMTDTLLVETNTAQNATVNGTLTNYGVIRKTQAIGGTGVKTFGLTGVAINVTTQGTLSSVQVDRIDRHHPTATVGIQTGRYWRITPTGEGYTVTLTLPHNNLSDPKVCKYPGNLGGAGWDCARDDKNTSTVWRSGITAFSDWAVGNNVGPTAVTLRNLEAHGADLADLRNLSGLAAMLLGLVAWRPRRRNR